MKVDFIILGAQKCATTTLFEILSGHPSIEGAREKEPHFFSLSPNWKRDLARYHALFRDPVDRIVSSCMHNVARGYTREPIEKVVKGHSLYLAGSRYYTQIIPYIRRFGRERVLLIEFDEFVNNMRGTLRRVTDFLGVEFDDLPDFAGVHANRSAGRRGRHCWLDALPAMVRALRALAQGAWRRVAEALSSPPMEKPRVSASFRRMFANCLEVEIRALEELMDRDLGAWQRVEAPGAPNELKPRAESDFRAPARREST